MVVSPPSVQTVRFALLGARDAALDRSEGVTDASGHVDVWLTAPSSPGPFELRAQVGNAFSLLSLEVQASPLATIEIVPIYAGQRSVTQWVTGVHVERRCEDIGPIPGDAKFFARVAPDKTAFIPAVPRGAALAVTARAAQFAGGCVNVGGGATTDTLRVEVPVVDRPLALATTELDVALGLSGDDASFIRALDAGLGLVRDALLDGADDETTALLDAMEDALGGRALASFRAARSAAAWEAMLAEGAGVHRMANAVARWVAIGRSALLSGRAFEGRLTPDPARPGEAPRFDIERIAELGGNVVGAKVTMASWVADPTDTLAFNGLLTWQQPALVTALAAPPARAETGADRVPGALAKIVDCERVGATLAAGSDVATLDLIASCDAKCLAVACQTALTAMWERAASLDSPATLAIAAAGRATVGSQAQAVALDGNWVGKLTVGKESAETRGSVRATAPRYSAR